MTPGLEVPCDDAVILRGPVPVEVADKIGVGERSHHPTLSPGPLRDEKLKQKPTGEYYQVQSQPRKKNWAFFFFQKVPFEGGGGKRMSPDEL